MSIYQNYGKRLLDILGASALMVATAPVHAGAGLAVLVTSGRPVYFVQDRVGRDGQEFRLLKFRTMKVGTHEASGGYPTPDQVTKVGRILRRSSLDELPQLINVLLGEMSLVGPRPALPDQVRRYTPEQRRRLRVKPGLTGLAQVNYRNNATWSVRIEADLDYVDTLQFSKDIRILLRTVPSVALGSGIVTAGQRVEEVDDLGEHETGAP